MQGAPSSGGGGGGASSGKKPRPLFPGKDFWSRTASSLHESISNVNNSKIFAGLMIITLNIASKFVTIRLNKTMENYLKYTFSRQILVFAIAWMGTRDIYIALMLTLAFIVVMDFLLNEASMFCVLPQHIHEYYANLEESQEVSYDDYIKAKGAVQKFETAQEASIRGIASSTAPTTATTTATTATAATTNSSSSSSPSSGKSSVSESQSISKTPKPASNYFGLTFSK